MFGLQLLKLLPFSLPCEGSSINFRPSIPFDCPSPFSSLSLLVISYSLKLPVLYGPVAFITYSFGYFMAELVQEHGILVFSAQLAKHKLLFIF